MKRQDFASMVPNRDMWPTVNISELPPDRLELFNLRYKAINMYIDGESISDIKNQTQVPYKTLQKLLSKCIEPGLDGRIRGYTALIPYIIRNQYIRKADSDNSLKSIHGGFSGLLSQTLTKYPQIDKYLRQLILKKNSSQRKVHEKSIRAKDLHQVFLGYVQSEVEF